MGKRARKREKKRLKLLAERRCPFGDWSIPKHARIVEWKHLTETIRDESEKWPEPPQSGNHATAGGGERS